MSRPSYILKSSCTDTVGIVAAAALGPSIAAGLYEVPSRDPLTLASTALFMVVVALLAAWVPARRAATADPVRALRQG